MASGQEDPFSYDLTALVDYEPDQTTAPATIGVGGGRLNTPPPPTGMSPGIGVGTNTSPSILSNVTVGVGGTRALRQQAGRPPTPSGQGYLDDRPTVGHKQPVQQSARTTGMKDRRLVARATRGAKEPRRVPRQNTPSSSSSSSDSGGRGSGRGSGGGGRGGGSGGGGGGSGGGGGGGGSGGGGGDDDEDDDDADSTPSGRAGPSTRARRRILNDQEMEQQLAQILQDQRQMAAGRRIAGITTTNTITDRKRSCRERV